MNVFCAMLFCCLVAMVTNVASATPESYAELNPKRITAIEAMLPEQPAGFGRPISDRVYWNDPKTRLLAGDALKNAEALLDKPFPAWSDELYLDFKKTGQRPPGEAMLRARLAWLEPLTLAECLENKGRFLPALRTALEGYVSEPTWTLPAHDNSLDNFHRKHYEIELRSAGMCAGLAEALYLLGDKLDPALRLGVMQALDERCFRPVSTSLVTGKGHYWLHINNNWNSVCLAGVAGAALSIILDRHERAIFAAMGEHYCKHFLSGFGPDGYCEEGGGYWSYGVSSFVVLREELVRATNGQIELFADPKVANIALYGVRFQLNDRLMPAYADCRYDTRANEDLLGYCNQTLHLGLQGLPDGTGVGHGNLGTQLMTPTPCATLSKTTDTQIGIRSYFDHVGVLVCRPSSKTSRLAASIKAGGNGSHSHNDIGSFVVNLGKDFEIGDAGGPFAYNNETFGPNRFKFKLLNSFGHPVPVVAGRLQLDATKIKPVVLSKSFSDTEDTISIDLTSAYDAPELKRLVRTMRFDRQALGTVVIEDAVEFNTPSAFETALTTRGTMQQIDAQTLAFSEKSEHLNVTVETPDGYMLRSEEIQEMGAPVYSRIGLTLTKPILKATIRITFRPLGDIPICNLIAIITMTRLIQNS